MLERNTTRPRHPAKEATWLLGARPLQPLLLRPCVAHCLPGFVVDNQPTIPRKLWEAKLKVWGEAGKARGLLGVMVQVIKDQEIIEKKKRVTKLTTL